MAVKPIISNIYAGRNLVPKSTYKGPILKLTKKEQAAIKQLEEKAIAYEIEQFNIRSYMDKTKLTSVQKEMLFEKLDQLSHWIQVVRENIQNIKIERLNKQKAKA